MKHASSRQPDFVAHGRNRIKLLMGELNMSIKTSKTMKEAAIALSAAIALTGASVLPAAVAHASPAAVQLAAGCNPCTTICNPCAAAACNPCAVKTCNPCAASSN